MENPGQHQRVFTFHVGLQLCSAAPTIRSTLPEVCTLSRLRSMHECSEEEKVRRFFFRPDSNRCKPYGICPEDAKLYDDQIATEPTQNYFRSLASCMDVCTLPGEPVVTTSNSINGNIICTLYTVVYYVVRILALHGLHICDMQIMKYRMPCCPVA